MTRPGGRLSLVRQHRMYRITITNRQTRHLGMIRRGGRARLYRISRMSSMSSMARHTRLGRLNKRYLGREITMKG